MKVRPFEAKDEPSLREVARVFPRFQQKILRYEGMIFVVEREGCILGAIKGKVVPDGSSNLGVLMWLMIHPDHLFGSSRSITKPLMETLIEALEMRGCDTILTCIDPCNRASARGAEHFGFRSAPLPWQLWKWGWRWPKTLHTAWHLVDLGQSLYVRQPHHPPRRLNRLTWLFLALLFSIPFALIHGDFNSTLAGCLGFVALRDLPFLIKWGGKRPYHFHGFESALLPCALAALCGQFLPYFGTWLPSNGRKPSPWPFVLQAILMAMGLFLLPMHWLSSTPEVIWACALYLMVEFSVPFFPFKASLLGRWLSRR